MNWNHQLLRRFSSSHFRLLNQLRSELCAYPLKRDTPTRQTIQEKKSSEPSNNNDKKRYVYSQDTRVNESSIIFNSNDDISKGTFKDRLNAIDMR